jgi:hypothetical protein
MADCHDLSFRRFTPRASRGTRLFIASLIWSGVGTGLFIAGLHWLVAAEQKLWLATLPVAMAIGWAKGRFVLLRRAEANAERILLTTEARCIGGVFTWGSWLLALVMIGIGITLRHSPLPRPWLGVLYAAIGTALFTASLRSWSRWSGKEADEVSS